MLSRRLFEEERPMARLTRCIPVLVLALCLLGLSAARAGAGKIAPPVTAASGDFAGLVDIGGRNLYLECRGKGSPTVVLEDGAGLGADLWSVDLLEPAGGRPMVLPTVAGFTRVCAYDRPGTIGDVNPDLDPGGPDFLPSRSDPAPMPRTARETVPDLHALLQTAGVPGPYVLVGRSLGGAFVRLYAAIESNIQGAFDPSAPPPSTVVGG
jgi:pimeloyl-ACP methyl ester carboxylesterase